VSDRDLYSPLEFGGAIVLSAVIANEVVAALRTRADAPSAGVPPMA